jgi:hypothetical protein
MIAAYSSNVPFDVIRISSRSTCIVGISPYNSYIILWNISGLVFTPIGNLLYWYFPQGTMIVHISSALPNPMVCDNNP